MVTGRPLGGGICGISLIWRKWCICISDRHLLRACSGKTLNLDIAVERKLLARVEARGECVVGFYGASCAYVLFLFFRKVVEYVNSLTHIHSLYLSHTRDDFPA